MISSRLAGWVVNRLCAALNGPVCFSSTRHCSGTTSGTGAGSVWVLSQVGPFHHMGLSDSSEWCHTSSRNVCRIFFTRAMVPTTGRCELVYLIHSVLNKWSPSALDPEICDFRIHDVLVSSALHVLLLKSSLTQYVVINQASSSSDNSSSLGMVSWVRVCHGSRVRMQKNIRER